MRSRRSRSSSPLKGNQPAHPDHEHLLSWSHEPRHIPHTRLTWCHSGIGNVGTPIPLNFFSVYNRSKAKKKKKPGGAFFASFSSRATFFCRATICCSLLSKACLFACKYLFFLTISRSRSSVLRLEFWRKFCTLSNTTPLTFSQQLQIKT